MPDPYIFGRFEVRPDERQVLVDGKAAVLGARALDLLLCLIERRDRVVGKDELLQLVWPGVVVEENNLTVQISALRKLLGPQAVATVAGRGYRFTLTPATASQSPAESDCVSAPTPTEIDLSLPDKPSIAVLPFANMSGDAEQEYFTDGVTEDIITELSRFHSLFVIARNSSFTYKGKAVDVRTVAKELGVRYVLEGSVRKAANRIRVTAQLVDSVTGNHIWAEKYDRVMEDVFDVQEEVTLAIVASIAPQIDAAERDKASRLRPENLSAHEIGLRAWTLAMAALGNTDTAMREEAARVAREALAIDPRSRYALNALELTLWQQIVFGGAADRKAVFDECMRLVATVIRMDPSDSFAHTRAAWAIVYDPNGPRVDEALAHARHAYELNPNSVDTLVCLGYLEGYNGHWDRGTEHLLAALRRSPRDPRITYVYSGLAQGSCFTAEYANGVEYARRGVSTAPNYGFNHVYLAMNYVGCGELDKAGAAFAVAQRLIPAWVESRLQRESPILHPSDRRRFRVFLRVAAGLEEPSAADAVR